MYCKNCGKELENGSTICKYCGWKMESNNEEKPEYMNLEQVSNPSQNAQINKNNMQNFNNAQNFGSMQNENVSTYSQNGLNQSTIGNTQQNGLNQNRQINNGYVHENNFNENVNNNSNQSHAEQPINPSNLNQSYAEQPINQSNINQSYAEQPINPSNINQSYAEQPINQSNINQSYAEQPNNPSNINQSYTEQPITQSNINQLPNSEKKQGFLSKIINNKILFISLITIFSLIIIGLIIFITVTVLNKNGNKSGVSQNNITTTKKREIVTTKQGSNENVSTSNVVTLGGYKFTIPGDLYHEIQNKQLAVTDSNNSFALSINVGTGSYDYFKANLSLFEDEFNQMGFTTIFSGEKSYSGLNYLIVQLQHNGMDAYLAIYKLSDTEVSVSAVILNNSTADNAFARLSEIFKTARKVDSSSTSEFNISEFSKEISDFE